MSKPLLYLWITVGGVVGGYLPVIFGADGFSIWSVVGTFFGSIAGIYLAYKMSN